MTPSADTVTESQFRWAVVCALCVLILAAYANTFTNEFVWDDVSSVLLHKHVQDSSHFFDLFTEDQHAFAGGQGNFYRPLVSASFMVDFALAYGQAWGAPAPEGIPDLSPFVFHVTNILWHLAASVLLFALLTRLDASRVVRLAVPVIFAVHPLHTEAVAYISGRADPMSAAFMFAGLIFATWDESGRRRAAALVLTSMMFIAALLSKESALIFPILLVPCLACRARSRGIHDPGMLNRYAPAFASLILMLGYLAMRATVLNFGSDSVARDVSYFQRLMETAKSFAIYIRLLFVPQGLHMERTELWLGEVPNWTAAVGVAAFSLCVAVVVWAFRRKRTHIAAGMIWFLSAWLPVSGIFPLNAPMAEHWMYVPMAGFLWAVADFIGGALRSPRAWRVAGVAFYVACVLFVAQTVSRNRDWRDNETIYSATLEKSPESIRVRYNLAVTYEDIVKNSAGARREYEKIVQAYDRRFEKKTQTDPGGLRSYWHEELRSHLSLAELYFEEARYNDAAAHFRVLLGVTITDENRSLIMRSGLGLGRCYLSVGDTQSALEQFNRVIGIEPGLDPEIRRILFEAGVSGP